MLAIRLAEREGVPLVVTDMETAELVRRLSQLKQRE